MAEEDTTQLHAKIAQLERQVAESRELFEAFMGNSPVGAFLKNEDGKYVYANRKVDHLIGGGYGQWSNKSDADLWPAETARAIQENDRRALESNGILKVPETVPREEGDQHFLAFKFPFTTSVGNRYLAGIWLDVTDRVRWEGERSALLEGERLAREEAETALKVLRQTEARLHCLFDSQVIGIIEMNADCILDANDSFLRMVGRSRDELKRGLLRCRDLTPAKYHAIDDLAIERLLRDSCFQPFEKQLLRRDGTVVPVWVGGALLGAAPNWTCVAFFLDLTERKDLEAQFLSGQRLKSLGLLAGGVAHDFNNLLTTIMGNASLAIEALTPEHPAYRPLEEVLRASRVASDLTQQLKVYSGKATGVKPIYVSDLVREIGGIMEVAIPRKIDLRLNLQPGLPPIAADPAQVQQIVLNLVINAADAIGEDHGTITISTCCRAYSSAELGAMTLGGVLPEASYVTFEIADTGCGMRSEVKARIFDPLFTTKPHGMGLGLAPVQGIIRSHHGALQLDSEPGRGTVFTVLFPASMEEDAPAPELQRAASPWGNELVMIVDDEPSIRRMAEMTLTRFGYQVITAADGKEAVGLFHDRADEISLVILDIAMPEMGGEEALEHMLRFRPKARIVLSSGYDESETTARIEGHGFIPKPYTSRQLAEQVRGLLAS